MVSSYCRNVLFLKNVFGSSVLVIQETQRNLYSFYYIFLAP